MSSETITNWLERNYGEEIPTFEITDECVELSNGNFLYECEYCSDIFESTEPLIVNGVQEQDLLCGYCEENTFRCYNCGEREELDDSTMGPDDNIYCNRCAERILIGCDDCGEVVWTDNTLSTNSGDIICDTCYNDRYFTCEVCENIFHIDDSYTDGGDARCEDCHNERTQYGNEILGYHEFTNWSPKGRGSMYMGFELEIENTNRDVDNSEAAREVKSITENLVVCEQDGSLNNGFEIISHPMTFNYIREHRHQIVSMLDYLRESGFRSHDPGTCGLHFHISKGGLGKTSEEVDDKINMILLIFETFKDEFIAFSRRKTNHINRWAQFMSTYFRHEDKIMSLKYIKEKKNETCRYMAVNLQPRRTIEFRLWRGTLSPSTFFATVALTENIVTYVLGHKNINGLTWERLLGKNEELIEYSKSRNIVSTTIGKNIIIRTNKKPIEENNEEREDN